jgi:hypothetical protein
VFPRWQEPVTAAELTSQFQRIGNFLDQDFGVERLYFQRNIEKFTALAYPIFMVDVLK